MSAPKKKPTQPRQTWPIVAGIVAAVVAALLVVAIVASAGGDDDGASVDAQGNGSGSGSGEPIEEIRPVQVSGEALPPMPEDDSAADPAVGMTGPTLTGRDFAGNDVVIEPGQRPTMIVFLAHWCPHCQDEVPVLVDWINAGEAPEGLDIFAVSTSVDPSYPNYPPSEWLAREGWPKPVLADSKGQAASAAYGLTAFPYFVVTGADGTVKARASGELPKEDIVAIVNQAMAA